MKRIISAIMVVHLLMAASPGAVHSFAAIDALKSPAESYLELVPDPCLIGEKGSVSPKSSRTVDEFVQVITCLFSNILVSDKAIVDGSTTKAATITLNGMFGPLQKLNLLMAYEKARNLYPEYLSAYPDLVWSVKQDAGSKTYQLTLQFKGAPMAVKLQHDFFRKTRSDALKLVMNDGLSKDSKDKKIMLAIAEYIAGAVIYDDANPEGYHGYGAAVEGRASCQGYTAYFNLMARMMGVQVTGIAGYGNGGAHIWTKARMDGEWVHVDMTWVDANGKSKDGKEFDPNNRYFAMSGVDAQKDHEWFVDVYGK